MTKNFFHFIASSQKKCLRTNTFDLIDRANVRALRTAFEVFDDLTVHTQRKQLEEQSIRTSGKSLSLCQYSRFEVTLI